MHAIVAAGADVGNEENLWDHQHHNNRGPSPPYILLHNRKHPESSVRAGKGLPCCKTRGRLH